MSWNSCQAWETYWKKKNKRQKQVDILLAVDMMNHAARGNIKYAALIAGDQDFTPLVDALVNMGLFVEVYGDSTSTSQELRHAADAYFRTSFRDYHLWSVQEQVSKVEWPSDQTSNNAGCIPDNIVKTGKINNLAAILYGLPTGEYVIKCELSYGTRYLRQKSQDRVLLICELTVGKFVDV